MNRSAASRTTLYHFPALFFYCSGQRGRSSKRRGTVFSVDARMVARELST